MPKEVQQVVTETLLLLKTKLLTEIKPQTREEAAQVFKDCLQIAFSEIDQNDQKTLYKKLSIQLHPDKLKNSQPELFAYLDNIDATTIPQQELNEFNEDLSPDIDVTNSETTFLIFYLLETFVSVFHKHKEYPEPIRMIAKCLITTIGFLLVTSNLVVEFVIIEGLRFAHIKPLILLEEVVINLLTGFGYRPEHDYLEHSDGFKKIETFALAIFNAIAEPLPEDSGLQAVQVLIKTLQVLLAPLILAACIIIETANYALTAVSMAATITLFTVALSMVVILNLPLYILDAVNFLIKAIDACFGYAESEEPTCENKNPFGLLLAPGSQKEPRQEPGEQGSYAKFFKSQPPSPVPSFTDIPDCAHPTI